MFSPGKRMKNFFLSRWCWVRLHVTKTTWHYYLEVIEQMFVLCSGSWWMWFMRHIGISEEHINSTHSAFFAFGSLILFCALASACVWVSSHKGFPFIGPILMRCGVCIILFDNQFIHRNVNRSFDMGHFSHSPACQSAGASTHPHNHILNTRFK